MSNGGSIKFIHGMISFEMSCCEKKASDLCLSVKLICAWFHFLFYLREVGKMGDGKEKQRYFSFPVTG